MTTASLRGLAAMAFRNLGRHRVKTVITTLAVAVSVALYIIVDAWLLGMNLESQRNIVAYETGAAKVQTEAYFAKKDETPMYESFTGWEALASRLQSAGYNSAPRFVFTGTLYSRAGAAPLVFHAVDFEREARLLRYPAYVEVGRLPRPGVQELILGTWVAEKLHVGLPRKLSRADWQDEVLAAAGANAAFVTGLYRPGEGDTMVLRDGVSPADEQRLWSLLAGSGRMDVRLSTVIDVKDGNAVRHVNQLIDAVVVGVTNSPNPMTNGNIGYLPLDSVQDDAGLMLAGRVTELLVRAAGASDTSLPSTRESAAAIRAASSPLPSGLAVHAWRDYVPDYVAVSAGDQVSSRVMVFFLFALAFIGIANTMLLAILERTKEIGMLRALGMTDKEVLATFILEAAFIGVLGSAIGTLLGCLGNIPMVLYGIDYGDMSKQLSGDFGYRVVAVFRSTWNPEAIVGTGLVAILVSAAAALPPTLRALSLPVTESLRFE